MLISKPALVTYHENSMQNIEIIVSVPVNYHCTCELSLVIHTSNWRTNNEILIYHSESGSELIISLQNE